MSQKIYYQKIILSNIYYQKIYYKQFIIQLITSFQMIICKVYEKSDNLLQFFFS